MKLTLGQIADWIHAEGGFDSQIEVFGYSIDSRTVGAGELFFAVTGERLDGHEYVQAAMHAGAAAAVVSTRWIVPAGLDDARLLRVPESEDCVLRAMQSLARHVRRTWGGRVIGITGSAGKTTTKECVSTVLASQKRVLKSAGNLNNHFGVPLQLLRLEPEHEIAVIEMGMNHAGEIAALARIAEPDWGLVSNVAPVHTENFADGIEGVAAAKYELIAALPAQGIAFLNADDRFVARFGDARSGNVRTFGVTQPATVRARNIQSAGAEGMRFTVETDQASASVHLALLGEHNVLNALAAVAVGLESGIPLQTCADALATMQPGEKRGQLMEWNGARIVNDTYNSNPVALNAMVDTLMAIPAQRHLVIAGEMLELGAASAELHAACGEHMHARGVDQVIGVRGFASDLVAGAGTTAVFLETPEAAGLWMRQNLRKGDVVLLKASRGVCLERAIAVLLQAPGV